ncbi:MAG: hypothetical protein J7L45_03315 [Candidatus Aenigmarchaeota archaeon]|nr:hypothetical protein [Candidatus Aenigmarchaeota archaeon]
MRKIKDIYPWVLWGVIALVIFFYIFLYLQGDSNLFINYGSENISCPIEYGKMECVNGSPVVGFYNPNKLDLKKISLIVPSGNGVDIYHVIDPLKSNKTEMLVIFNSNCSLRQEDIELKWCCENCYSTYMKDPSEDIKVGENEKG